MSKGTKDNADDNQPDQSNIGNTKTQNISADKYLFKQFLKSKILQLFQMSEAQEHKVFPKGKGDRNNAIRH